MVLVYSARWCRVAHTKTVAVATSGFFLVVVFFLTKILNWLSGQSHESSGQAAAGFPHLHSYGDNIDPEV